MPEWTPRATSITLKFRTPYPFKCKVAPMPIVVSVVVPVYNGERTLADCLRALQLQDLAKSDYEVIVVCDGSTDSSATLAEGFGVRLLNETKRQGAPSARNTGFRAARGQWVA